MGQKFTTLDLEMLSWIGHQRHWLKKKQQSKLDFMKTKQFSASKGTIHRVKEASLVAQSVKNLPAVQETRVQSLGWEDPLEKEMATHSSILTWKIPWTEEPGELQFMGSQRVGHD